MVDQINGNNSPRLFYPVEPSTFESTPVAGIGQGESSLNSIENNSASSSPLSTVKAIFTKIVEFVWGLITKVTNRFWSMKMEMHMAEVEEAQLDGNIEVDFAPPVAGQPKAVIPNVVYTTEQFSRVSAHLYAAKKETESSHPAERKLLALRGAFYNALHPDTQKKLTQLIHEKIKEPNLKTLKDHLLNDQFWTLFSDSVERVFLKFSVSQLDNIQNIVQNKPAPIVAKEFEAEFKALNDIDFWAIIKLAPKSWALKFAANSPFDEQQKQQALNILDQYMQEQKSKLDQIVNFVEIGA